MPDELHLEPAEAMGVALSTGPLAASTMDQAQAAAPGVLQHLERLGYALTPLAKDEGRVLYAYREAKAQLEPLLSTGMELVYVAIPVSSEFIDGLGADRDKLTTALSKGAMAALQQELSGTVP